MTLNNRVQYLSVQFKQISTVVVTVYERELFDFLSKQVHVYYARSKLSYNTKFLILLLLYIYFYCDICYPLLDATGIFAWFP